MIVSGLKKTLGAFNLDIESLSLSKPGIYGLIGPNGCGKTTVAKILSGVVRADSGNIDNEGLDSREITMIPQKSYFIDDSVYNNLVYPLKIRGIRPEQSICDACLEKIALAGRRNQHASSLSSGEQQKLALMRAVIFEPKFIIVDEALTDLDIDSLDMFERMFLDMQERKPIIWLVISHQLAHVQRLCDYVFFMENGKVAAEGPADEILLRPKHSGLCKYLRYETLQGA